MKEKMISKIILVLIMMVMIIAMPMHTFATSGDAADLNQFWEDQGGLEDLEDDKDANKDVNEDANKDANKETAEEKETNTKNENNNEYNKAGLAEDTMMVVAVIALGTIAVFANKKVNELKNI